MSGVTPEKMIELRTLVSRLERSRRVHRYASTSDAPSVDEIAAEAADSLIDICKSANVLCSLLPRLAKLDAKGAEFDDVLDDIAEELRHIHYHVVNTYLFRHVIQEPRTDPAS